MIEFLRHSSLLWAALGALIAGYALLASGDITLAPLLLVIGYCVLLPLFLWRSLRGTSGE